MDLEAGYDHPVIDRFLEVFSWIPLGAIIDGATLCVHGGIGPHVRLGALRCLARPIERPDIGVLELLWSDPTERGEGFRASPRGNGCLFAAGVLRAFLAEEELQLLVRGHQAIAAGVEKGPCWVTVHSCSDVASGAKCGLLLHRRFDDAEAIVLPALENEILRGDVGFTHLVLPLRPPAVAQPPNVVMFRALRAKGLSLCGSAPRGAQRGARLPGPTPQPPARTPQPEVEPVRRRSSGVASPSGASSVLPAEAPRRSSDIR
jgi:hypothetical protein